MQFFIGRADGNQAAASGPFQTRGELSELAKSGDFLWTKYGNACNYVVCKMCNFARTTLNFDFRNYLQFGQFLKLMHNKPLLLAQMGKHPLIADNPVVIPRATQRCSRNGAQHIALRVTR